MKKTFHMLAEQIKLFVSTERFLWRLVWKTGFGMFLFKILLEIFFSFVSLAQNYLWKIIIEQLVEYNQYSSILYFGILCIIPLISSFFASIGYVISLNLNEKIRFHLHCLMSERLNSLSISFYDDPKNRDMIEKAWQYQATIQSSTGIGLNMVFSFITIAISFALILPYNWWLCLLYVLTHIPGAIIQYRTNQKIDKYSIDSIPEVRQKDYYKTILTSSEHAKDLRLYNLAPYMKDRFSLLWKKIRRERSDIFKVGLLESFFASLLSMSGLIILIVWAVNATISGTISLGVLAMFIGLATDIGMRVRVLIVQMSSFMRLTAPRIMEYKHFIDMNFDKISENQGGDRKITKLQKIEFVNVSFRYPNCDEYVLHNLSFTINSSEKIALVGTNGSGKSTIIKLILRFYEPTCGKILINDKDVKEYSLRTLRMQFGVYFQELTRYALTMRENIAVSEISEVKNSEKIDSVADLTGIDSLFNSLPFGIDTQLFRTFDENGYEPSGGQWQKIGLARALFRNSAFLILDEPSSALDPEAENLLFSQFKDLLQNKGALIVSHRLSVISLVDKVIFLESGRIKEFGTHAELMRNNDSYAEMYLLQSRNYKESEDSV